MPVLRRADALISSKRARRLDCDRCELRRRLRCRREVAVARAHHGAARDSNEGLELGGARGIYSARGIHGVRGIGIGLRSSCADTRAIVRADAARHVGGSGLP